jgi:MFS family permease
MYDRGPPREMLLECLSVRVRGPAFSRFDLLAACGTSFLKNLTMTIVLPVVLSSAEARDSDSPLLSSGLVAASFSVGMVLSTSLMCCWPTKVLDSRLPFVLCACLLLVGNAFYLAAELLLWPTIALIVCRFGMALGFGAQFAGKRRCSVETSKSRREYAFMLVEAANSAGQAAGPILMGTVGLLASLDWSISDPGDVGKATFEGINGTMPLSLDRIQSTMQGDLFGRSIRAPFGQLYRLVEGGVSMLLAVVPAAVTIVLTIAFLIAVLTLRTDVPFFRQTEAPPPTPAAHGSNPKEATPLIAPGAPAQQRHESDDDTTPAPLWVSYVVQCSCLFYGVARNFLFFGFESAAVVVYNRELLIPVSAASLWVGCCALTPLVALALYSRYRSSLVGKTQQLLLASELMGVGASLLFLASSLFDVAPTSLADAAEPDAAAQGELDGVRGPFLLLLTFGSVCFYGSVYLGAATGNSHPLSYAVDGHPLLSRSAMIAEQQILQSTLGKGLGMVVCRVVLGDPVRLENLARLFLYVMATQIIVLALGWDPLATQRRWRAVHGRLFAQRGAT